MAKVMGFFTDAQMDSVGMNGAGSAACEKCGLSTSCKSPRMGYTGNGRKGILIVSECPSDHDDNSGTPFSGDTSKWFAEKLRKLGIDLHNDCWKTNAVGCHPKNEADKQPQRKHVIACSPRLMRTIEELKPRFIWLMGEKAITAYFHKRDNDPRCVRWRGLCVPDPDNKAWILPMYHPKYAMQQEKDENFQMVYNKDLSYAVRCSKFPDPPEEMSLKGARIIKDFDEAMDALESTLKIRPEKFAFDYECTGLKPYRNAHRIATISWCSDWDTSYAIPYQYRQHFTQEQQDYIADVWTEIMLHKDIKKVIQNSKFEDAWTRSFFGVEPNNVWWCTLNAAHILDTRKHFSGLKFQAHIRWGIPDYDSSMEKYLKTDDGTPFNRVMEAPLNDLLLYNSIDSLLTFRLQEEQEEDISKQPCLERGRAFFMDGLNVLCDMQENGVRADADYYKEQDLTLGKRIITLNETLHDMDEAKKFERVVGRPINFGSNADLSKLFYEILGYKATKQTSSGNDSTDKEALASLKSPLAAKIAEISKLEKIKGTYLAQFLRELDDDGRIHPFFDLHTTQTLRGSANSPNLQNIPVRDSEAMLITRGGLFPSLGKKLIDWDYGAMEVRVIASITQCPVLIKYINDPSTDMHRDQAMELFGFKPNEWDEFQKIDKKLMKNIRFHAKNGMVFALFYGSYYRSIARTLFALLKELKVPEVGTLFEWLRSKNIIRSLATASQDFEDHAKKVEKKFWFRFKAVKAWQEKNFKDYLNKGFIENPFGFRIGGWLTKNDLCNYPIQGTAFHCLVWSLHTLNQRMKAEKMDSLLIGQIHDCCLAEVVPSEEDRWCQMSYEIATKEIRIANPWLLVPLDIEFERAEVDQPWSTKKEFFPNLTGGTL